MNCDACIGAEADHHMCDACVQEDNARDRQLRARVAAVEKERDGLKAALREVEAKLTKGPYQFDGWSVVADAARLMARDALKVRAAVAITSGEAL